MSTGGRRPRLRLAALLPSPLVASGMGTTGTSWEVAVSGAEPAAGDAAERAAWACCEATAAPAPLLAPLLRPRRLIGTLAACVLLAFSPGAVAAPALRLRSCIANKCAGGRAVGSQRAAITS